MDEIEDFWAKHARLTAYWKSHPAELSTRAVGTLVNQGFETEEDFLAAVAQNPHVMRTWPNCAKKTINEFSLITGYGYRDTKPPSTKPEPTREEVHRRTLEGFAATLRKAGWIVTPPD